MKSNYHFNNIFWEKPLEFDGIQVVQIGRLYCKNGAVVPPHIHTDLLELTIVTDGEGIISTNGIETKVKQGDIYLSLPCDIHRIESDQKKPLKYDYFAFKTTTSTFHQNLNDIMQKYRSEHLRVFREEKILPLISNAIVEINSDDTFSKELLSAIFNQVLIYVIRSFENKTVKVQAIHKSNAEILCYKLMNYIDTHLYTMKSLSELSDVTDYSYGYLSALFKKTTSSSLANYYRKKKLDAAQLLLAEGKLSATQISDLLNYSTVYAFSKAFKQEFGVSPTHYK